MGVILNEKVLKELEEFVQLHLEIDQLEILNLYEAPLEKYIQQEIISDDMEEFIKNRRKPTFQEALFRFIDKKGTTDADIYKKAGMDRRHFSKIRSNPNYKIGKNAAIALAFALELNEDDTDSLLSSAGYSLSDSDTFDLVIQFCLEKKIYHIHDVNQALDFFSLKPLT